MDTAGPVVCRCAQIEGTGADMDVDVGCVCVKFSRRLKAERTVIKDYASYLKLLVFMETVCGVEIGAGVADNAA